MVYKRGSIVWFSFVFNGQRIQRSTKQGSRKAGKEIEAAVRTALGKAEVGLVKPKRECRTIADLLDALKASYVQKGKLLPRLLQGF